MALDQFLDVRPQGPISGNGEPGFRIFRMYGLERLNQIGVVLSNGHAADSKPNERTVPAETCPSLAALIRVGAELFGIDTVVNNLDSMGRNDVLVYISLAHAFRHSRCPTRGGVGH